MTRISEVIAMPDGTTEFTDRASGVTVTADAVREMIRTLDANPFPERRHILMMELIGYGRHMDAVIDWHADWLRRADASLTLDGYAEAREDRWLRRLRVYEDAVCLRSEIAHAVENGKPSVIVRKPVDASLPAAGVMSPETQNNAAETPPAPHRGEAA